MYLEFRLPSYARLPSFSTGLSRDLASALSLLGVLAPKTESQVTSGNGWGALVGGGYQVEGHINFSAMAYTPAASDRMTRCVDCWFSQGDLGTPLQQPVGPSGLAIVTGSPGVEGPPRSHLTHQVSLQAELCLIQFPKDLYNFLNMTFEVR